MIDLRSSHRHALNAPRRIAPQIRQDRPILTAPDQHLFKREDTIR
jgi:hypothetical protein